MVRTRAERMVLRTVTHRYTEFGLIVTSFSLRLVAGISLEVLSDRFRDAVVDDT